MKKFVFAAAIAVLSHLSLSAQENLSKKPEIRVDIDLVNVKDDKVKVTLTPPKFKTDNFTLRFPKIVPGTYSKDDYGRFIEGVNAFDKKGNPLKVKQTDDDSWAISGGEVSKITYLVNDSYDIPSEKKVFSPAGTNILADKNFVLNLHAFVGYFTEMMDAPYQLTISHPSGLFGATSSTDTDASPTQDVFKYDRYFEVTDHPIMYSAPDYTTFTVDGMEVLFSVYSPKGTFTAKELSPGLEKMMRAQKKFLGDINKNKKYAVLLYLSDMGGNDANGFGALEHNSSTTMVYPEMTTPEQLQEAITDVVSHEFFHTVTPLSVHSNEIHYFDYTTPKMSEHLWMYEGITEYFANLFQVNQGLITEDEFYDRMSDKIKNASKYKADMPFTVMSKNVIEPPYKDQYNNVYEKGALIGMCLDILIREKSGGDRGVLDLMRKLSNTYGANKPFSDNELFSKITELTYPEVGAFLETYVSGYNALPYEDFLAKVGVAKGTRKVPVNPFLNGAKPYVTIKPGGKEIVVINGIKLNNFMNEMKLTGGDIITSVNGTDYNIDNIYGLLMESQDWKEGDSMTIKIKRDGTDMTLTGKVKLNYEDAEGYTVTDHSKDKLREAWLKK
ncbi:MAG: peptidase M61 [Flavobacterium sp.]|nr:MAG: peptidase M61 [Flavobacterium sp.]